MKFYIDFATVIPAMFAPNKLDTKFMKIIKNSEYCQWQINHYQLTFI